MERTAGKDLVVLVVGLLAAFYLVYPSGSVFEFLPDFIPFIGSLDEASATLILASAFRYFGLDFSNMFKSGSKENDPNVIEGKANRQPGEDRY